MKTQKEKPEQGPGFLFDDAIKSQTKEIFTSQDLEEMFSDDSEDTNVEERQTKETKDNTNDEEKPTPEVKKKTTEEDDFEEAFLSAVSDTTQSVKTLQDTLDKAENAETKKEVEAIRKEIKSLIDEGLMVPYDNEKDISEYTIEELRELIKDNINYSKEEGISEFMESLPEPVQLAIKYSLEQGEDYPKVLRMVADAMEGKNIIESLNEKDIVRTWLKTKGIDEEEIESLVNSYDRKGILKEKVTLAKQELEKEIYGELDKEIEKQSSEKAKKEEMYKRYVDNVSKAVNSLDVDKSIKKQILDGLTKADYTLSNGVKTNKLYYLLEKYQFKEDKHDLVAEALWLLSDPEGYKKYIKNNVKKEVIEETIRPKLLKTEKKVTMSREEEEPTIDFNKLNKKQNLLKKRTKFNFDV